MECGGGPCSFSQPVGLVANNGIEVDGEPLARRRGVGEEQVVVGHNDLPFLGLLYDPPEKTALPEGTSVPPAEIRPRGYGGDGGVRGGEGYFGKVARLGLLHPGDQVISDIPFHKVKEFLLAQFLALQPAQVIALALDKAEGQVDAKAAAEVRKIALDYLLLEGDARGQEKDGAVFFKGPEDRRHQ